MKRFILWIPIVAVFAIACDDKGNKDSKASTSDASSFYELPKQAELNLESFNNRYAALVVENGKSHFIDEKGKLLFGTEFSDARHFSEGLAPVQVGQKWGYVDPTGKMVIEPRFIDAYSFKDGLACVALEERPYTKYEKPTKPAYGYIDKTGRLVIADRFGKPSDFKDGITNQMLFKTSTMLWINKQGQEVQNTKKESPIDPYSEGLKTYYTSIANQRTYGYVDVNSKIVIPAAFASAGDFVNGFAPVKQASYISHYVGDIPIFKEGLWAYIDKAGNTFIKPTYTYASNYHCINNCDGKNEETSAITNANPSIGSCITNGLRIRAEGNVDSSPVAILNKGDKVQILDEKTTSAVFASINGVQTPGIFIKVQTSDGKIGWVFSGGIESITDQQIGIFTLISGHCHEDGCAFQFKDEKGEIKRMSAIPDNAIEYAEDEDGGSHVKDKYLNKKYTLKYHIGEVYHESAGEMNTEMIISEMKEI